MQANITPQEFIEFTKSKNVNISRTDASILTLTKSFTPLNAEEYYQAEDDCSWVMSKAPVSRSGSTWGTTSDGMGAISAMQTGYMRLNRSGINMNWLKRLAILLKEK